MLRKVDELERRRKAVAEEMVRLEQEHSVKAALATVTEQQVAELLSGLAADMAENPKAKQLLRTFVERVELDPASLHCQIHYKVSISDSLSMASPRGGGDGRLKNPHRL